ncbi:hypothetical protein MHU86_25401 [Fragilaria crotonensis]|nr:hypothetical protein MHU86_25401 [Fragilaria crotonensis]
MWPFSDPEVLARERRKIERQQRWQRFQFWKRTRVTKWQPTLGERIASTYFPVAYLMSLCCLIYYAWRKGIRNRAASRRLQPSSNGVLSSRTSRKVINAKESLVSIPASSSSANPEPNCVGSLALSTGSDSSGDAPVPQPLRPFSVVPVDLAPVSQQSRPRSVAPVDSPEVKRTLGSKSKSWDTGWKKKGSGSEASLIREGSGPQSMQNISMDPGTDPKTSNKQKNKPKRRKSRSGAKRNEPLLDDFDMHESEANRNDFKEDLMVALRTGLEKSKSARPRDERTHDESGTSTDGSSNHENFRSRSSSPITRTNKIRQMHFFEEMVPTEAKPRVCRRTSMPLSSLASGKSSEWKGNTMRRSKSAEELIPDDAPPLVVFPTRKAVEEVDDSCAEPRDFRLLRLKVHDRTGSMSCATSLNGRASMCESTAPSLAGSCFAPAELERLKRTIMLRERQAGENERRLSSSTSGSTSTRDSSVILLAQIELLQKKWALVEETGVLQCLWPNLLREATRVVR